MQASPQWLNLVIRLCITNNLKYSAQKYMPRNFYLLLVVQFISTVADNAFLIVAIARVIELTAPDWITPILKLSFSLFYVLLAPLVGAFSDTLPKGKVMLLSNILKVCAAFLMLAGLAAGRRPSEGWRSRDGPRTSG